MSQQVMGKWTKKISANANRIGVVMLFVLPIVALCLQVLTEGRLFEGSINVHSNEGSIGWQSYNFDFLNAFAIFLLMILVVFFVRLFVTTLKSFSAENN